MKKHQYEYDEVVIGNSLAAVFYSFVNNCPLLFQKYNPPNEFEFLNVQSLLNFNKTQNSLKMPNKEIILGNQKKYIYDYLLFVLSASGLTPFSDKIKTIRIQENTNLKIITDRARTYNVKFNKLKIFNFDNIEGFLYKVVEKKRLVCDYFKITTKKHDLGLIDVGDDFVNKIFFKKNIICVHSKLTKDELKKFEYSVVPLKYKLLEILSKNNIEKASWRSNILLEHIKRKAYNLDSSAAKSNESIKADSRTVEEICQNIKQSSETHSSWPAAYHWKLHHLFLGSNGTTH